MDDRVLSEVHIGTPPQAKTWHTEFYFHIERGRVNVLDLVHPEACSDTESDEEVQASMSVDPEGDLVLCRRKCNPKVQGHKLCINICHQLATSLPDVGLQASLALPCPLWPNHERFISQTLAQTSFLIVMRTCAGTSKCQPILPSRSAP